MLEQLKPLIDPIIGRLRALPPAKLFGLLGLVGIVVTVGLVSLLWIGGDGKQDVLYAQLTMEDAAAIASELKDMAVPYTIEGNGTTIMVPSTMVYDLRLRLASAGLPHGGGAGFELFDQRNFGMTEFMQKLNYRRALQGELARTISQLAAVHSARVHIVLPEKTLLSDQQDKTTASIVLKFTHGRRLIDDQIRGITHLVASSVEGLHPDDVTLVDSQGKRLGVEENDPAMLARSEAQLAHQRKLEQTLERQAQTILARAIGKDKVLVRVSATLDFQRIERSEERYDADNPAIRSEQRSKEEGQGPGYWAVGVPGTASNVENGATPPRTTPAANTNAASRQTETINYEVSKIISKVVVPSGDVKRLSVAVLVDGTYTTNDKGERTYVPRTEEELAKFEEIAKSAVGYNEARGDQVEIANIPFEVQDDAEAFGMGADERWALWIQVSRYAAYIIFALLGFVFVLRPLTKWITAHDEYGGTMLPRTVQELEADMEASEMLPGANEEADEPLELAAAGGQSRGAELRTQVSEFATSEPERAAEILRMWLKS